MAQNIKASLPGQEVHYGTKGSVVIAGGTVTLDGANPTRVDCQAVHGIRIVEAVTANFKNTAAPGVDTNSLTVNFTGTDANADFYAWKVTGAGDATEVASTNSAVVVSYTVIGLV